MIQPLHSPLLAYYLKAQTKQASNIGIEPPFGKRLLFEGKQIRTQHFGDQEFSYSPV